MDQVYRVLAINPGSTSTKIAVYDNETNVMTTNLAHTNADLAPFATMQDQFDFRRGAILAALESKGIALESLHAVSGRGGGVKPVPSGTFRVNDEMVADCSSGRSQHASILGAIIAQALSRQLGIPAFIVDPTNVDEADPIAKVTGLGGTTRPIGDHPLNQKAIARKVAAELGRPYPELNLIIAHVGGGISVCPHRGGRIIEVEPTLFSPERVLPRTYELINMVYSGKYTEAEIRKLTLGTGGLYSYFGTKDVRDVEKMIDEGNAEAALVFEAMAYHVAKAIGACYSVLKGKADALAITGGVAHSKRFIGYIRDYCRYIDPILVYPGENELEALALGALRVVSGAEKARVYPGGEFEA